MAGVFAPHLRLLGDVRDVLDGVRSAVWAAWCLDVLGDASSWLLHGYLRVVDREPAEVAARLDRP